MNDIEKDVRELNHNDQDNEKSTYESKIIENYREYIKEYAQDEIIEDELKPIREDIGEEEIYILKNVKAKNRRYKSSYRERDLISYKDILQNMYKRDMMRLARNRTALDNIYSNQENWLRNMKCQVINHEYGFSHKL